MSKTLPWRTLATPLTPSDFRAPSMALPCGSRIPDFKVTVTRAFIFGSVFGRFLAVVPPIPYVGIAGAATSPACLMHRCRRLCQQPAITGNTAAFADQPHRRPERRGGRRHHRNAMTVLKRLGHLERAQSAAGDQNAFGAVGVGDRAVPQRN